MIRLGNYNHFEAQLPMALEAIIDSGVQQRYDFELNEEPDEPLRLDLGSMIKQIVGDVEIKTDGGIISAKFHNTLAAALLEMAKAARERRHLNTVALSGGVFCNRYLTSGLIKLLKENDFSVLLNCDFPSNDGGISVGQAAIAVSRINTQ